MKRLFWILMIVLVMFGVQAQVAPISGGASSDPGQAEFQFGPILQACDHLNFNSHSASEAVGKQSAGSLVSGVKLPDRSYFNKNWQSSNNDEQYGTIELVNTLELTACYMNLMFESTPLKVHDLSVQNGGKLNPHKSHQNGLDVDVGFYLYEGTSNYVNVWKEMCDREGEGKNCYAAGTGKYNVDLQFLHPDSLTTNWWFIKTLINVYDVRAIAFDQVLQDVLETHVRDVLGEGEAWDRHKPLFANWPGHHDHYHIRLKCPKGDLHCEGSKAEKNFPGEGFVDPGVPSQELAEQNTQTTGQQLPGEQTTTGASPIGGSTQGGVQQSTIPNCAYCQKIDSSWLKVSQALDVSPEVKGKVYNPVTSQWSTIQEQSASVGTQTGGAGGGVAPSVSEESQGNQELVVGEEVSAPVSYEQWEPTYVGLGIKFFNYETGCESNVPDVDNRMEGVIVPDVVTQASQPDIYFYFHGHTSQTQSQGDNFAQWYAKDHKKLIDSMKDKNAIMFVMKGASPNTAGLKLTNSPYPGSTVSQQWMKGVDNYDNSVFHCFYEEAIDNLWDLPNVNDQGLGKLYLMGHSAGGQAIENILLPDEDGNRHYFYDSPKQDFGGVVLYDACYGKCNQLREHVEDELGRMYVIWSEGDSEEQNNKKRKDIQKIMGSNFDLNDFDLNLNNFTVPSEYSNVVKVMKTDKSHGDVPIDCLNSFETWSC
jgi:hypothetical protein